MPLFNPPLEIESNGIDLGTVQTIDFTTGITVSQSNETVTVSDVDSGGSSTQIEINFGSKPTRYKTFTITDGYVTAASKIIVVQSGNAPSGRSADENEMDPMIFSATSGSGHFTLTASTLNGPVVNNYKVIYMVT